MFSIFKRQFEWFPKHLLHHSVSLACGTINNIYKEAFCSSILILSMSYKVLHDNLVSQIISYNVIFYEVLWFVVINQLRICFRKVVKVSRYYKLDGLSSILSFCSLLFWGNLHVRGFHLCSFMPALRN